MTRPKRKKRSLFAGKTGMDYFYTAANERKRLIKKRKRKDKNAGRK